MARPGLAVLLLALLLLPAVAAAETPEVVSGTEAPWSSLAYVTTNIGTRCTGVLVGPDRLLTAAHCLVNRKTRHLLQAVSLHVIFGYNRGAYRSHITVAEVTVSPAFDAGEPQTTPGADWAVLRLSQPADPKVTPPLGLADTTLPDAAPAALVGFRRDKAHILTGDLSCHLTGGARHVSGPVLLHDCASLAGQSGAPLLAKSADGWRVAGIHVGHRSPGQGVAVPIASLAKALAR